MLSFPDLLSLLSIFETMGLGLNSNNNSSGSSSTLQQPSDSFSHPALHPEECDQHYTAPNSRQKYFESSSRPTYFNKPSSDIASSDWLVLEADNLTVSPFCQKVFDSSPLQTTFHTQLSNENFLWQLIY